MSAIRRFRAVVARLIGVWRKPAAEARMAEEMDFHLERLAERLVREGYPPEEARRRAALQFGGRSAHEESARDQSRSRLLEDAGRDVALALRMLRRSPGFALVTILTLALGVGANTAIFSVVYAVLLKPLPYDRPEQLFTAFMAKPAEGIAANGWSYPNFRRLTENSHAFSGWAATQQHELTLTGHGDPRVVTASVVTPGLFSLFGVQPARGRLFAERDGTPGAAPVVVMSEGLWRSAFGADPAIVGQTVTLDQRAYTVIGVAPAAFRFPAVTAADQFWVPLAQDPLFSPWMEREGGHWLRVFGRLKPGVSETRARAELDLLAATLDQSASPNDKGWSLRMLPLQEMLVNDIRPALLVLLGAVALVLVITCVNITSLVLARGVSRAREITVRTALGAGRARIIRQLLTETVVLGLLGGLAGVVVAQWGVRVLTAFLPATLPQLNAIRVDYVVLGFGLLLAAMAGLGFGIVPACLVGGGSPQAALGAGGARSGETAGARRARRVLVVTEVALAMVLLVGAGLLLRSFARLTHTNPGFDADRLVKAEVPLPRFQYSTPDQWAGFADALLSRLESEPGMGEAGIAVPLPLADGFVNLGFSVRGAGGTGPATGNGDYESVSAGYFRVMGIPLVSGRAFDERDVRSAPRVAIVSRALARLYFPDQDPVGRDIAFGFPPSDPVPHRIVGVVGDVRDVSLGEEPRPMMYVPFAQEPLPGAGVVVRSRLGVAAVAGAVRRVVNEIDRGLPVTEVAAMPDVLSTSVAEPRFRTWLIGVFAAMALALAATGIFGVISYSVSCRTREIGIRVALGASRNVIRRLILGEALTLALAGLALGIPVALAGGRVIRTLLFGTPPGDPVTLVAVGTGLVAVALIAGYLPVRRALNVDPVRTLHSD